MTKKEAFEQDCESIQKRLASAYTIRDNVVKNLTIDIIWKNNYIMKLEADIEALS